MSVLRDISGALGRAASGCAFNFILLATLATVRGQLSVPLTALIVGLGLASAVGVFGWLICRSGALARSEAV